MADGDYLFLHEDDLWDNFLELWPRLTEHEKHRLTLAYREFCRRFRGDARSMQLDEHPSLPGMNVVTIEPLTFHFELDHDNRAVFLFNMFYAKPKL